LLEDYPRVTIVFFAAALEPLSHEELCPVAEFDQSPPRPQGVDQGNMRKEPGPKI
jgi:hypothetical protein